MNTKPKTSLRGTEKATKAPPGVQCVNGVCSLPSRPQVGRKSAGNSEKR